MKLWLPSNPTTRKTFPSFFPKSYAQRHPAISSHLSRISLDSTAGPSPNSILQTGAPDTVPQVAAPQSPSRSIQTSSFNDRQPKINSPISDSALKSPWGSSLRACAGLRLHGSARFVAAKEIQEPPANAKLPPMVGPIQGYEN